MRFWAILFLLFQIFPLVAQTTEERTTFAFRSIGSREPVRMIIVGEIVSIDKVSVFEVDRMSQELGVDTRMDTVTIKVSDPKGIRVGQTLYILEKDPDHKTYRDGNIVGEVTVKSVFQTTFFGWQVRGEGYLRLIEDRPMTAARAIETAKFDEAILSKKKGDYFLAKGKPEEAIRNYKTSISLDPNYPDAHYALGKVHWQDGEGYVSSAREYSIAWKNRERFSTKEENLLFYLDYMRFLLFLHKTEGGDSSKHLDTLASVVKESKKLAPKNFENHLYSAEMSILQMQRMTPATPEERKQYEDWSEKAEEALDRANRIRSADFYLQKLACEFYNLKWKEMRNTHKERDYREKLIEHGKLLRMYYTGETNLSEDLMNSIRLAEKQARLQTSQI